MKNVINTETILNTIKNQFFSLVKREKEVYEGVNFDISLERQYITYENFNDNTIYIVISLKPAEIIHKAVIQPLEIYFISEHNNISLCQKLLLDYSSAFNLKELPEESIFQTYSTPQIDDSFFDFFEGFRGTFTISGSFVYTPEINDINVFYYPKLYVTQQSGNVSLNRKLFVEKMANKYLNGEYQFKSIEENVWSLSINGKTYKNFTSSELLENGISVSDKNNFSITVNSKKNVIDYRIELYSVEEQTSLSDVWLDEELLLSKLVQDGEYVFEFNSVGNKWIEKKNGTSIYFLSQYGIFFSGVPKDKDKIIISVGYCKEKIPLLRMALNLKPMPDSQVFYSSNNTPNTVIKAKAVSFSFSSYLLNIELLNRIIAIHNEDYEVEPDGEDTAFKFEFEFKKSKQKIVRYYKCVDMNITYGIGELPAVSVSFSK